MRKVIFTSVFVFMISASVVWAGERGSSMKTVVFDGNSSYLGVDTRDITKDRLGPCLLYTSPSPRDMRRSRMPSSA